MDRVNCTCGNALMIKDGNGNVTINANLSVGSPAPYQCTRCGVRLNIPNEISQRFGVILN